MSRSRRRGSARARRVRRAPQQMGAVMKIHLHALAAAGVTLLAVGLAHVMTPRELMARASDTFDLQSMIPRQFGEWTLVPGIRLVEPAGPDALESQLYSQEVGRGYADRDGDIVMLVVA